MIDPMYLDTGDFNQMRDDDLDREMERQERREMQDPVWLEDQQVCTNRTGSLINSSADFSHDTHGESPRQQENAETSRKPATSASAAAEARPTNH